MVSQRKFVLNSQSQSRNLSSFIEHSLENARASELYRENAVRSGDPELAYLFQKLKKENYMNADKARQVLSDDL